MIQNYCKSTEKAIYENSKISNNNQFHCNEILELIKKELKDVWDDRNGKLCDLKILDMVNMDDIRCYIPVENPTNITIIREENQNTQPQVFYEKPSQVELTQPEKDLYQKIRNNDTPDNQHYSPNQFLIIRDTEFCIANSLAEKGLINWIFAYKCAGLKSEIQRIGGIDSCCSPLPATAIAICKNYLKLPSGMIGTSADDINVQLLVDAGLVDKCTLLLTGRGIVVAKSN